MVFRLEWDNEKPQCSSTKGKASLEAGEVKWLSYSMQSQYCIHRIKTKLWDISCVITDSLVQQFLYESMMFKWNWQKFILHDTGNRQLYTCHLDYNQFQASVRYPYTLPRTLQLINNSILHSVQWTMQSSNIMNLLCWKELHNVFDITFCSLLLLKNPLSNHVTRILSTDLGNEPDVWFWAANTSQFSLWLYQHSVSCLWGSSTPTHSHKAVGFAGFC